ncbi:ABC transporter permease [Paenibacillus sp. YPG26]|uniref:ABC transporter permease n=1 Tax=Paenibacillus sp. YPG26 TaxID=2878915 RepID=UPI00203F40BF|nr:ABC transporter permease [Paenibacillus sp. YPG26]USB32336.1 ABC transporter permease [Paenibacillus sp. YPG26]
MAQLINQEARVEPGTTPVTAASKFRKELGWLNHVPAWLHGLLVPIALLILWQIAGDTGLVTKEQLPTPLAIIKRFIELGASGELYHHLGVSSLRALGGFMLGSAIGLLVGMFIGIGKIIERTLDPSLQMLRTVPLLALIPLFILWFGIGEFSKILMISLGAFFPVYLNTFLGIRSVDTKLYDVSRILGYSRWHQLTKLIIPSALPNILLGLRLAMSTSWLILVFAELMGTSAGIGYMIEDARTYSNTDIVFVGIILFALVGSISDIIVHALEKRWLRWWDTFKG